MAKKPSVNFDYQLQASSDDAGDACEIRDGEPFRILLLGDFLGANTDSKTLADRKAVEIDRDNFDEQLAAWQPRVNVSLGEGTIASVTIRELDDFEPDQLFRNLPAFASLLSLRQRLQNTATFNEAKEEINKWGKPVEQPLPQVEAPAGGSGISLDQLVDNYDRSAASLLPGLSEWDRFIQETVAPYVIAAPDPKLRDYEKVLEEAISVRMRTILHDPGFQAMETIWRGLYRIVRNLDTDDRLKIFVLNATRAELEGDLKGLYQQVVTNSKNRPWAVIAGDYSFAGTQKDLELLGNIAQIATKANVSFIAAGHSSLVGCESFGKTPDVEDWVVDGDVDALWNQIRQFPPAQHVALTMPRYLARMPYGKSGNTIDSFPFEELTSAHSHENFLWGNGAFICALMLGQSYSQDGDGMRVHGVSRVNDLPIYVYDDDGDRVAKPVAEAAVLSESLGAIADRGFISFMCARAGDFVQVTQWQSITGDELIGRWSS